MEKQLRISVYLHHSPIHRHTRGHNEDKQGEDHLDEEPKKIIMTCDRSGLEPEIHPNQVERTLATGTCMVDI